VNNTADTKNPMLSAAALALSLCAPAALAGGSAAATVHIKNCVKGVNELEINVSVYDADDSIKWVPANSTYRLVYGNTTSLTCDGDMCHVFAKVNSGTMDDWEDMDSDKYGVVEKVGSDLKIYEGNSFYDCPE